MSNIRHFFGLKKDPFPQDVPVKDLFPIPALDPLEKRVLFAVEQKAITVITGDVGAGKSTSLRYISSRLHSSEYAEPNCQTVPSLKLGGTLPADSALLRCPVFLISGEHYDSQNPGACAGNRIPQSHSNPHYR